MKEENSKAIASSTISLGNSKFIEDVIAIMIEECHECCLLTRIVYLIGLLNLMLQPLDCYFEQ